MSKVILRVEKSSICPLSPASTGPASPDKAGPADSTLTGFREILNVDFQLLKEYASNSGWIVDVAEVVFGSNLGDSGEATLWKLDKNESVDAWKDKTFDPHSGKWNRIKKDNPQALEPGIYEYRHWDIVLLRYYKAGNSVSWPAGSTTGTAPNFSQDVNLRDDNKCVITKLNRLENTCTASHLTPEKLGHSGIVRIMERFKKTVDWQNAHLDRRAGVLLYRGLDELVDKFKLAFYTPDPAKPTEHVMHNFSTADPSDPSIIGITVKELQRLGMQNVKSLHKYPCKIADRNTTVKVGGMDVEKKLEAPPLEVFRWHYTQCVLRRFNSDYQTWPNILW